MEVVGNVGVKQLYHAREKNFFMYTKTEIEEIFNNCKTLIEFDKVAEAFHYLIENKFQHKSLHLNVVANLRYRELLNK